MALSETTPLLKKAIGEQAQPADDLAQLHLRFQGADKKSLKETLKKIDNMNGIVGHVLNTHNLTLTYKPKDCGARTILKMIQAESPTPVEVDPAGSVKTVGDVDPTLKRDLSRVMPPLAILVFLLWVLPRTPYASIAQIQLIPGINVQTALLCLLATPIMFIQGARFHKGAWKAIKTGVMDMNVLISTSTLMTFGYSLVITCFSACAPYMTGHQHDANPPPPYFEAPCMIIAFLLVGKCLEGFAKQQTADSLNQLLGSQPLTANLLQDGTKASSIPVELVQIGDRVQVFPGDAVPVDGILVSEGEAGFDEALLTGESKMIMKQKGDFVIGGSRCLSGRVEMEVQRVGSGTMLNQISSLVERAQTSRAPVQTVADNIAQWFVPSVMALSVFTALVWYFIVFVFDKIPMSEIAHKTEWPVLEKALFVMQFGLTTLLVACPCALGLATPTAVMTATGAAAKFGVLLKNGGLALELGSKITHIVLDKTGTITEGKPKIHRAAAMDAQGEAASAWNALKAAYLRSVKNQSPATPAGSSMKMEKLEGQSELADTSLKAAFWWAVGSTEISSEHPLAKVLVDFSRSEAQGELVAPSNFENIKGKGVSCTLDGMSLLVGSVKSVVAESSCKSANSSLEAWANTCRGEGATVIAVAVNGIPLGGVALRDQVAPYAKQMIAKIQETGTEIWMCTGDHATTAAVIAKECGIQPWKIVAEALPADKVKCIEKLQSENKEHKNIVAMVGDGINDSPALATADVGIAIGAGHNVTVDAADVVLISSDFRALVSYLQLSKEGIATIWKNFLWAFLFNMAALPVAAGVFFSVGIKFTPYLAVAAMAASSLFVVNQSLNLRNFEPKH